MARKKSDSGRKTAGMNKIEGLSAQIIEQKITETLEVNYMPYAMSVIVSRAIPEIDGFKPSHRKLLYTMYTMGLLRGQRTKSANIVGQTMRLNPHGDAAIYETMVRLSQGNETLLCPFVESKGNFGKVYSRDMAYAASRYTEAKLAPICAEIFGDIDKDAVDLIDNYDATMKEPNLLPTAFPNVLVSANTGIAVSMASNICGFNLAEVCRAEIEYLDDENCDLLSVLKAPDFTTGGEIIYNAEEMRRIYETGKGSFKIRARWRYIKEENLIEVYEIPYTTTIEAIIDKITDLAKDGKLKEINDVRDETDLGGLKLTMELKRGTDPEKLMAKLFKLTPLMDSYACNFNILIGGIPKTMGVREILEEWTAWRTECIKRTLYYDIRRQREKLHLLEGLGKILLDIDKAIAIIRNTEEESEVVPNLMIGFGIDEVQAEFVADIRLRNINKEYILKRTAEIDELRKSIADMEDTLKSRRKVRNLIKKDLQNIIKKYGEPRKTYIVYDTDVEEYVEETETESYPVTLFLSREGYFKKITPQSLRQSGEQKYKEGDGLKVSCEADNNAEILIFTDKQQVYKTRASEFPDTKASVLGSFLPSVLEMDDGESVLTMVLPGDYAGSIIFFFENGKASRVPLSAYATKTNRRKLTGAYSDKSCLASILPLREEMPVVLYSTDGRALIVESSAIPEKTTRASQGVAVMTLKKNALLERAETLAQSPIQNVSRYKVKTIPAAGAVLKAEDSGNEQLTMLN